VGVLFADQKVTRSRSSSNPLVFSGSTSSTYGSDTALWGAGVQYNWHKRWSARLDFQRYSDVGSDSAVGEQDIDLLSLNVIYRL
jgi:OmpA-like transmembrane domain